MANELTTYTKVHRVHNMEVATGLDGTNPENYVALVSESREKAVINVPLKNTVKVYIEEPTET